MSFEPKKEEFTFKIVLKMKDFVRYQEQTKAKAERKIARNQPTSESQQPTANY